MRLSLGIDFFLFVNIFGGILLEDIMFMHFSIKTESSGVKIVCQSVSLKFLLIVS